MTKTFVEQEKHLGIWYMYGKKTKPKRSTQNKQTNTNDQGNTELNVGELVITQRNSQSNYNLN